MESTQESRTAAALLGQHRALRKLLDEAVECARAKEAPRSPRLLEIVGQIAAEIEEHNRLEEEALGPILRGADAWGPERIAHMLDHHRAEHVAFVKELRRLTKATSADATLVAIENLATAVRKHMDLEEREYLNSRVLRDDIVALDATGG